MATEYYSRGGKVYKRAGKKEQEMRFDPGRARAVSARGTQFLKPAAERTFEPTSSERKALGRLWDMAIDRSPRMEPSSGLSAMWDRAIAKEPVYRDDADLERMFASALDKRPKKRGYYNALR